jgi:hypothetical protein
MIQRFGQFVRAGRMRPRAYDAYLIEQTEDLGAIGQGAAHATQLPERVERLGDDEIGRRKILSGDRAG